MTFNKKGLSNLILKLKSTKVADFWPSYSIYKSKILCGPDYQIFEFFKILLIFCSKNGQIWRKSILWNFEGQNFKNGRKKQHSGCCKFFLFLKSLSKQKIMSFEQFLRELLVLKIKIWHIFNCIENPIHLKIGPHFN